MCVTFFTTQKNIFSFYFDSNTTTHIAHSIVYHSVYLFIIILTSCINKILVKILGCWSNYIFFIFLSLHQFNLFLKGYILGKLQCSNYIRCIGINMRSLKFFFSLKDICKPNVFACTMAFLNNVFKKLTGKYYFV